MDGNYPECEKLAEASKKSSALQDFIEWLEHEKGVKLFRYQGNRKTHFSLNEEIFADYFKIDLDKVENERRAILDTLRSANA
jgi:hypothetical protein